MKSLTILIGNVGADPEIRNMPNGGSVANFNLATTEKWKNAQGEKQEKTSWHRLTVFGKLADVVSQYVHKGDRLYIEGRLDYQEYEKDGVKKYSTQIIVNQLQMLGSPGGNSNQGQSQPAPQKSQQGAPPASADFDDDIPFSVRESYP